MGLAVVTFAVLVVVFCAFAHRLGRWNVTAPIVFVVAGAAGLRRLGRLRTRRGPADLAVRRMALTVDDQLRTALSVVGLTVMSSVLAHGLSASPLASRYGRWVAVVSHPPAEIRRQAGQPEFEPQPRGSVLRTGES